MTHFSPILTFAGYIDPSIAILFPILDSSRYHDLGIIDRLFFPRSSSVLPYIPRFPSIPMEDQILSYPIETLGGFVFLFISSIDPAHFCSIDPFGDFNISFRLISGRSRLCGSSRSGAMLFQRSRVSFSRLESLMFGGSGGGRMGVIGLIGLLVVSFLVLVGVVDVRPPLDRRCWGVIISHIGMSGRDLTVLCALFRGDSFLILIECLTIPHLPSLHLVSHDGRSMESRRLYVRF